MFRIKNFNKNKNITINYNNIETIFKKNKIDLILHCATSYGTKDKNLSNIISSNLFLPLKLLDLAKKYGVKRFINTDTILKKNISSYTLSKFQFSEWLKKYSNDLYCCNVKIEHFFGPGDDDSKFVINLILKLLNKAEKIELTKGTQKRDFIYIDDVVAAIEKIIIHTLTFTKGYNNFEIGSGKSISIKKFINIVAKELNNKFTKLIYGALPFRKNEPMDIKVNNRKLVKLGWKSNSTISQGLKKTIKFYKKKY